MADTLSRSPDYRVLRRLVPRPPLAPAPERNLRTAILLDTETTGLDPSRDEIIELGIVKFEYLPDGRIAGVRDTFSAFNEPSGPIPVDITAITGITDAMVAGRRGGRMRTPPGGIRTAFHGAGSRGRQDGISIMRRRSR
jgi:DNA polymerase-3 subunit epsilon